MYKSIEVKGRKIQIEISRPLCLIPRHGQYPAKEKFFVFKWYAWGWLEIRRFLTVDELKKWSIAGIIGK